MTNPISNQVFSHDFPKFVYQTPDIQVINAQHTPKPFSLQAPEKASKTKKELDKQKQRKIKKDENNDEETTAE